MNGILVTALGNVFLGISLVVDKIFLKNRTVGNALPYVFWIGVLNFFGIFIFPFGFQVPEGATILLALLTGAVSLLGIFFYYRALERGEASETLPAAGGFVPIATLLIASILLNMPLNVAEKVAFGLLAVGGLLMFSSEKIKFRTVAPSILIASLFLGLASVLEKLVFLKTNFVSGFVIIKAGTLLAALLLLFIPRVRNAIRESTVRSPRRNQALYLGNRLLAGLSSFSLFYAISLTHPALVDVLGGVRYATIFLLALALSAVRPATLFERFCGRTFTLKIIATILIILGIAGLGLQTYFASKPVPDPKSVSWGITFSQKMSTALELDWRENYKAILSDLRPAGIRLVAYWDLVEPKESIWDFSDLDWQMKEAERVGVPAILVVGQRVPRWPECHYPVWLDAQNETLRERKLLEYLEAVVSRYRRAPNLLSWQVENEPFLFFGECPGTTAEFFDREIALVRRLDPAHPILTTDSGEFGDWYRAARRGDLFGTTMYRKVYNRVFGELTYPLTPEFFPLKEAVVKFLTGRPDEKFIVSELGLEPWGKEQIYQLSPEEQIRLFSFEDFKVTIAYAREARFDTYYAWGAEWWYWLKVKHDDPRFWDFAKTTFRPEQFPAH